MRTSIFLFSLVFVFSCETEVKNVDSCGDSLIDPSEQCDGAELGGVTCQSLGYYGGEAACATDCTMDLSGCVAAGRCGDDVLQEDTSEACDGSDLGLTTCESLGFYGGSLACSSECSFDTGDCESEGFCGDSEVQSLAEDCEGSNLNGQSCQSRGYSGGVLACGEDCRFDHTACLSVCGNSVVEPDEGCDDGQITSGDGCSADCQVEAGWSCSGSPSLCGTICGDGMIVPGLEECDGANLDGLSCEAAGYYGGTLTCTGQCDLDWSSCESAGRCGDGLVQAPWEECDGLGEGESCLSMGHFGGDLVCDGCVRSGCLGLMAVDGGYLFTCALDHQGNAWCWGLDSNGQVGNGADPGSRFPVAVTMPAGVHFGVLVAAKNAHACALDASGNAWCWGLNGSGQVGDNTTTDRTVPTAVLMPASTSFLQLAGGAYHTCALDTTGNAWCWGDATYGQLGRGTTAGSFRPVAVTMPPGVTFSSITAGDFHTCALTPTGVPYCWGMNSQGQLGDGTTTQRLTPTLAILPQNVRFSDIDAASYSTMALDLVGNLYTWGGWALARTTGSHTQPLIAQMPASVAFASVQGGEFHACALDTAGAAWCWGDCNTGECGTTVFTDLIRPVAMPAGTVFTGLGLGAHAGCGFDALGALWCWGVNSSGQLGDNTNVNRATPTRTYWP